MVIDMNNNEKLNLKELLKSNIVEVVFTKLNGEKRVMKCTLIDSYLPQNDWGSKELSEEHQETALAVWDLEAGGWRSFRYENVISFGLKNEEEILDKNGQE